ncbi:TRAF-like protein [Tanacetum coccineum]
MEKNIFSERGISFARVLEVVPFEGSGDKIKLPNPCFNDLSGEGAFEKCPLHFQLLVADQDKSSKSDHWSTHVGVLEFSAEESVVWIPPHIWNNLYSKQDPMTPLIEVKYACVSVLEKNIEDDITGPDTLPEKPNNQHVLEPLTCEKSQSGVINEGEYVYYKFSMDDDTWGIISQGEVKLDSEAKDGDTDLYLSQHPLLFPNTHQHSWSSHDMVPKCLLLGS